MNEQQKLEKLLSRYFSDQDIAYIFSLLLPWAGDYEGISAWLEKPIPAFGNITAIDVCEKGLSKDFIVYLAGINRGGFA
ncbi:MbcA/ParS/Xre antitoxin family protein [Shewanella inventionis]|uniref:antitoxin Xre/MbcA/ParS toxin-binding domain-containing protein n=1 Tax=Shewanella TaxID=22 RepID=UPI00177F343C|nr:MULTISPECIES: antitoxin Xre/MbcA/ParS toxin-binding domain-containing protein [Shewanella]MBO1898472.1 DUF2384 domain-containing protein [Shewanella sp. BF02_Schw]UAL43680.1 MbcA/ParS/Xre antitoxin family protein [Shewanella inventionis]